MRKLGIDYGDARVGIAITDPLNITAQGLETIQRNNSDKIVLRRLDEILEKYEVDTLIVGMPYNLKGEKINSFPSIQSAADANECHISAILNVLSGRCKQAHGYYWTYKDEPLVILPDKKSHRKHIYQFDLQGNIIKEFERTK